MDLQEAQDTLRALANSDGGEVIPFAYTSKGPHGKTTQMLFIRSDRPEIDLQRLSNFIQSAGFETRTLNGTYWRPIIEAKFGKALADEKIASHSKEGTGVNSRPDMGNLAHRLGITNDRSSYANTKMHLIIPQEAMQNFMALTELAGNKRWTKSTQRTSIKPDSDDIQNRTGAARDDL